MSCHNNDGYAVLFQPGGTAHVAGQSGIHGAVVRKVSVRDCHDFRLHHDGRTLDRIRFSPDSDIDDLSNSGGMSLLCDFGIDDVQDQRVA